METLSAKHEEADSTVVRLSSKEPMKYQFNLLILTFLMVACGHGSEDSSTKHASRAGDSYTEIPENYFKCQVQRDGQSGCALRNDNTILHPRSDIRLYYKLQYQSGCSISVGRFKSYLNVTQNGHSEKVVYDNPTWQDMPDFTGTGPIKLEIEPNREKVVARQKFHSKKGCFFKFRYKTSLSNESIDRLNSLVSDLSIGEQNYSSVKLLSLNVSTLSLLVTQADFTGIQSILADLQSELERYFTTYERPSDWHNIKVSIEEAILLNPAVDPAAMLSEKFNNLISSLELVNKELKNRITRNLAAKLVDAQTILSFASSGSLTSQRAIVAKVEKIVSGS